MHFSQPKAGQASFTGTQFLLTLLVSVALVGALVTQWVRPGASSNAPLSPTTPRPPLNQQGMLPGGQTPDAHGVVFSRDYRLWSYVATRGTSGLSVIVSYIHGTEDDLQDFVALNNQRAGALALAGGVVDVLVTFRSLMEPDEFREWVPARGLDARLVSLRLQAAGGARGTLTVAAQKDNPLPEDSLRSGAGSLPPALGVYSVRGFIPAERLPDLTSNPAVFVADVTLTLARLELLDANIPGAKDAAVNAESPFSELEELGMVRP
ncbi:MAG TPA: hypothetical protein VJ183_05055 [Chloroflexia bacterium]|nr:hypothetical protein [Chloroflexia bacterium]